MSDPVPPSPRRRHRRPGLLVLVGVVLVVGVAAFLLAPRADDGDEGDGASGWSEEVQPFVDIVEEERGLTFKEPVPVDFLTETEFEEQVTEDEGDLTDEDREDIEQDTGLLRALGLVGADVDLFDEVQRLQGSGVVGLYDDEDGRVRIRGEELTPSTRSTLVHELTHALQDQHFDIGARIDELSEAEDGSASAYRALVEGDASRIETAYVAGLPDDERAALTEAQQAEGEEFRGRSRGIPPVLVTLLGAPYALGEGMLSLATALDGNEAVDGLFADPPSTDEHLLDPWTLLVDETAGETEAPEAPAVGPGEKKLDSGPFGAFTWYVVLAQRLDAKTALAAVDGWGGDAFTSFERSGSTCVRVAYRGDEAADVDELAAALDAWNAAGSGTARVRRDGDGLVFEACAVEGAETPDEPADPVLQLPVLRTVLTAQLLEGAPPGQEEFARCYVSASIDALTVEQLTAPGEPDPAVARQLREIAQTCAGAG